MCLYLYAKIFYIHTVCHCIKIGEKQLEKALIREHLAHAVTYYKYGLVIRVNF